MLLNKLQPKLRKKFSPKLSGSSTSSASIAYFRLLDSTGNLLQDSNNKILQVRV